MIPWDLKYFQKFAYSQSQVAKYLASARKDLIIAKKAEMKEIKFQFTYNAFIKLGISLIACHGHKVRSRMGHHTKILEQTSLILEDDNISVFGNQMRKARNSELYDGAMSITNKQADAYFDFVQKTFQQAEPLFKTHAQTLL
jgi:hypothetical protein